jgi:hypothetical protein
VGENHVEIKKLGKNKRVANFVENRENKESKQGFSNAVKNQRF